MKYFIPLWTAGFIVLLASLIIPVSEFAASPLAGCILGVILAVISLSIFSWQVYLIVSSENTTGTSWLQLVSLFVLFNLSSALLWYSMWLMDREGQIEMMPPMTNSSHYQVYLVISTNTFSIFATAGVIRMFPVSVLAYLVQLIVIITGGFMWLLMGMWFLKLRGEQTQQQKSRYREKLIE